MNYSDSAITQALSRTLQFTVDLSKSIKYEIFDNFSEHYFKIYIGKVIIEIMNHKIISVINASNDSEAVNVKIKSDNNKYSLLISGVDASSISVLYSQGIFNFSCKELTDDIPEPITVNKNEKHYASAIHAATIASKQLEIGTLTADIINANTIKAGEWNLSFSDSILNIT